MSIDFRGISSGRRYALAVRYSTDLLTRAGNVWLEVIKTQTQALASIKQPPTARKENIMGKYFRKCRTVEELKKEYKRLVFLYHPDKGGDTKTMQEINAEYDTVFEFLKNKHTNAEGEFYEKETDETANIYKDIINKLIRLKNVSIEICGSWIWVTGDTFSYKGYLKNDCGFKWSNKKKAWYWHSGDFKKWGKKTFTLDEIRLKYGSDKISGENDEEEKRLREA